MSSLFSLLLVRCELQLLCKNIQLDYLIVSFFTIWTSTLVSITWWVLYFFVLYNNCGKRTLCCENWTNNVSNKFNCPWYYLENNLTMAFASFLFDITLNNWVISSAVSTHTSSTRFFLLLLLHVYSLVIVIVRKSFCCIVSASTCFLMLVLLHSEAASLFICYSYVSPSLD